MTQEDKELLLKDLCARLPYRVVVNATSQHYNINGILMEIYNAAGGYIRLSNGMQYHIEHIKPYLFPLSSMTEEQKKEYDSIIYHNIELHCERYYNVIDVASFEELQEFYHKNHLDYRNLIGFGLAIDATGLNIY